MFNYTKLEDAIKKSGKKKTFLCEAMEKPPYYLRDVIKQKNAITPENQEILARELNVSVAWLNDEEETEKPVTISGNGLDQKTADFIRLYQNAPDWIQDQVRSLLEAAESNREVPGDGSTI